jgi:acyl-CoA synthetase (AMP-forming)/AMP-acid ligase II
MIFRSPYPDVEIPNQSLTDFVCRDWERFAAKPALIDATTGRTLTYRKLAAGVRAVAAGLSQRGLRKGDVVAIFAASRPDYAPAFYGAIAAGGIVTTVNPLVTADELARQLDDARARFLITTPDLLAIANEATNGTTVREVFVFDEADGATPFADLLASKGATPDVSIDSATDVAVLPYSSGTTGLPKGVTLTHRNLIANVCQTIVPIPFTADEVRFSVPPFFHCYGLLVLNCVLRQGGTLVTLRRFDLTSFLHAIQEYRVTAANIAPPIAVLFANSPLVDEYDLSSLDVMTSGGAPLDEDLIRRCEERLGCFINQGFGMTEASPATHVSPIVDRARRPGAISQPVPNTECTVVDPDTGAELRANQPGELWVRGPQVMKGYLNRPDATAATITPDGWLRTGDLVSIDADGYLYPIDRLKELIKYKAYPVAPAELEAVLLAHPAVADAAVIPSPDEEAGEVPKAFVVTKEPVSGDDLMAYVAARVAPYKKVRRLEFIDAIPKSASGKILRRVLVERERAAQLTPA